MDIDLEPADEALNAMLDVLASRPGAVQDRLREAWDAYGPKLMAVAVPELNRDDVREIRDALAGGEPLDDDEASGIASAVVILRAEVALAYGRQQERESRARRWKVPNLGRWKPTNAEDQRRET
jgi:hypothetical protein